jgi:hypothetical protein
MPKKKKVPKRVYYRMYDGASIYRALWAGLREGLPEKEYCKFARKVFEVVNKELKSMGGS